MNRSTNRRAAWALTTLFLALPWHGAMAQGETDMAQSLESLSWMAGSWSTSVETGEAEEHWLAPRAGLMLGMHRSVTSKGKVVFEYLRIEERPEGIFYMASPMGREPTPFRLTELGDRRVVFEKPDHDFPKKIIYSSTGTDSLHARVEAESDGESAYLEWTFRRLPASRP